MSATKGMARPESSDGILPFLVPIPGLTPARMGSEMDQVQREFNERMEAERRAVRLARANDPHSCHCPFCTVIG